MNQFKVPASSTFYTSGDKTLKAKRVRKPLGRSVALRARQSHRVANTVLLHCNASHEMSKQSTAKRASGRRQQVDESLSRKFEPLANCEPKAPRCFPIQMPRSAVLIFTVRVIPKFSETPRWWFARSSWAQGTQLSLRCWIVGLSGMLTFTSFVQAPRR